MDLNNNIWGRSTKLLLVVKYRSKNELKEYREAIKAVGLNVHNCHILAVLEDKKENHNLESLGSVTYLSTKDFNLLGRLKNADAQKKLKDNFDLLVVVNEIPKKIQKLLEKQNIAIGVGINNEIEFLVIKLSTEHIKPMQLVTFVQDTLKKIT